MELVKILGSEQERKLTENAFHFFIRNSHLDGIRKQQKVRYLDSLTVAVGQIIIIFDVIVTVTNRGDAQFCARNCSYRISNLTSLCLCRGIGEGSGTVIASLYQ